jgi:hypothetical protein
VKQKEEEERQKQKEDDLKAHQKALKDLVSSWNDRLQLISVIVSHPYCAYTRFVRPFVTSLAIDNFLCFSGSRPVASHSSERKHAGIRSVASNKCFYTWFSRYAYLGRYTQISFPR